MGPPFPRNPLKFPYSARCACLLRTHTHHLTPHRTEVEPGSSVIEAVGATLPFPAVCQLAPPFPSAFCTSYDLEKEQGVSKWKILRFEVFGRIFEV